MRISDWSSDVCSSDLAPTHLIDAETYSELVLQGFRRSGLFTYRPHCDTCKACLPIRVNTEEFRRNRTQRKTWNPHSELVQRSMPLHWSAEHFNLYQRYKCVRHPGAGRDQDSHAQKTQFIITR